MRDIHEDTVKWAADRMLIKNGRLSTQALKLGSEVSELALNLVEHEDIKDDVGDCLVVMTILAQLQGKDDLLDIVTKISIIEKLPTKPIFPMLVHYMGELQDNVIKGKSISNDLAYMYYYLSKIAVSKGSDLLACWIVAYEDIKDRKGFLNSEGCFIKETDEEYQLLLKEGWIV